MCNTQKRSSTDVHWGTVKVTIFTNNDYLMMALKITSCTFHNIDDRETLSNNLIEERNTKNPQV